MTTQNAQKEKRYFLLVAGIVLAILSALAAFNLVINPYGVYRDWKDGAVYPAANTYERIHKTERIKRLKPEAVIIGTSRADIGIDPRPEHFGELTPYNASLPAATIYEQRRMLEFAHRVRPLRSAVIALDFLSFNTGNPGNQHFDEKLLAEDATRPLNSMLRTYGTAVSFNTLLAAIKHLRYQGELHRRSYHLPNGHKKHNKGKWTAKKRGAYRSFELTPNAEMITLDNLKYDYPDRPGVSSFDDYRAMLDFARRENIALYVFINPVHAAYLNMYAQRGIWDDFTAWKSRIAEITKPYDAPLWDFATFNPVTEEPVPAKEDTESQMRWFWDKDHYKDATGDIILRKLFDLPGADEHPEFGEKLL